MPIFPHTSKSGAKWLDLLARIMHIIYVIGHMDVIIANKKGFSFEK